MLWLWIRTRNHEVEVAGSPSFDRAVWRSLHIILNPARHEACVYVRTRHKNFEQGDDICLDGVIG
jgi:hypothetical protein